MDFSSILRHSKIFRFLADRTFLTYIGIGIYIYIYIYICLREREAFTYFFLSYPFGAGIIFLILAQPVYKM